MWHSFCQPIVGEPSDKDRWMISVFELVLGHWATGRTAG